MYFVHALAEALASLFAFHADVSAHHRHKTNGPHWSRRRWRRIVSYRRRQPRRRQHLRVHERRPSA